MQPTSNVAHQIKDRLYRAIDTASYEIRDREELARIVMELPKIKLTKSDLEETRFGKLINDIRKNTPSLDKTLAKILREVVKSWRNMCEIKPFQGNGNSTVDRSSSASLISPSSISNDSSRKFSGPNNYAPTVKAKESASSQHPALLRIRNQHSPLTSPCKDIGYHSNSISPKLAISPGKKLNNLYSRSVTASSIDAFSQQHQFNRNLESGKAKQLGRSVSPNMPNSFKNIFYKNGSTLSPANSTNMRASSSLGSCISSPALTYALSNSDSDCSNSVFTCAESGHDESSVDSHSNLSSHFLRFGNDGELRTAILSSEDSKSRPGRKRKIEPDTLVKNLNSVLNSVSGRKAQSTQEIVQNVMKNNLLSCQSSPVLNCLSATDAKRPRIFKDDLAYLDENAVHNFDAVHRQPAVNGLPNLLEPSQLDIASEDSLSSDVPYNFDKRDNSIDDELAGLYAKLPKVSPSDVDAVKHLHFDIELAVFEKVESLEPTETERKTSQDSGVSRIQKDILNKFVNEQWPGMNGNYDDEGNWCSYGDMPYVKPLMIDGKICQDDDMDHMFNTGFFVLPYTNCCW